MHITPLVPYARLPRARSGARQEILHSTVDAFGRAHWLLAERRGNGGPYDATVVTVDDGRFEETRLSAVTAQYPALDALPDGGFVVADCRRPRGDDDHVQVFDALGRTSWTFTVGDAIQHLLADESGDLWVGYFDEGVFGDPLSYAGVRRWSATGEPLWELPASTPGGRMADCYALNAHRGEAWVCYMEGFPLVRIRRDGTVRVWESPVRGTAATVVHDGRVAYFASYDHRDGLVLCTLSETAAVPYLLSTLVHSDGSTIGRQRRLARGSRLYVQAEPYTAWEMWDLAAAA
ncbi:hypothetical protein [Streptomyces xantholiticus]|uniref:Uncharacterized protein n=1 Tax=Streptomyces xantholiticus TaxID=68285 RepID=A0ABV1UU79_9ACTN